MTAYADSEGLIHIRPTVYCKRSLPMWWHVIPRTWFR